MQYIVDGIEREINLGDGVWIRDDLENGELYGKNTWISPPMTKGRFVKVNETYDEGFSICDPNAIHRVFTYTPEMVDWDKTYEIQEFEQVATYECGQMLANEDSSIITEQNLINQEFTGVDQMKDFREPFDLGIELDPNYPPKTRGFEKVSLEEFTEALRGTTYEKATQYIYDNIKLPKRGTKHSAGYDIFSPFAFFLEPNEVIKIPTGIKAYMQHDEMIAGYPRSSKGFKFFMRLANTVAIGDSDYHDNVKNEGHYFIKIRNEGKETMKIEMGEAFAQFIFQKYLITDDDSFDEGEERTGGIGSTDTNQ